MKSNRIKSFFTAKLMLGVILQFLTLQQTYSQDYRKYVESFQKKSINGSFTAFLEEQSPPKLREWLGINGFMTNNSVNRRLNEQQIDCCDLLDDKEADVSPDGCAVWCPIISSNYKRPSCSSKMHQVACLKGKAKSGTTWTEYLVSGLMRTVCKAVPEKCTYKEILVQEHISDKDRSYHISWDGEMKVSSSAYDKDPTPGCFKHIIPNLQCGNIMVIRDPRDVIVSRHFYTGQRGGKVTLQYAKQQLSEHQIWMKKVMNVAREMRKKDKGAILLVRYEEMNSNNPIVMKQIFDFLSLGCLTEFSNEFAETVYEEFAFNKLSKQEEKGGVIGSVGKKGRDKKMRKGKSFAFAEHFDPQVLQKIEAAMESNSLINSLYVPYYKTHAHEEDGAYGS